MSEFVVNIWHQFATDAEFERTIPLIANARRMQKLGMRNQVTLLFLHGFDRLSSRYIDSLKAHDYRVLDVSQLADELTPSLSLFVDRWSAWGGIKHFGLLRFLLMPRIFGNSDIITFDGDMIMNASFSEIDDCFGDILYFLHGSSCFASIPRNSGFFETFADNVAALSRNPEDYARNVMRLTGAAEFFDPHRAFGTDQAFILQLCRQRLITLGNGNAAMLNQNLRGFSNILMMEPGNIRYERRDGVDYLNDEKVLIWHMSHDVCSYLGQAVFIRDWLGDDAVPLFGRLPVRYDHYAMDAIDPSVKQLFDGLNNALQSRKIVQYVDRDPFSRSRVCATCFEETDFSFVLNDRLWHTPGVFA